VKGNTMSRTIAIANQKGGVGKTTTTINLSACLAEAGKKVLVIDMDPQGNCTSGFGINKNEIKNTIYELILGECSLRECTMPVEGIDTLKIIPANVNLAGAEIDILDVNDREYILKNEIDYVRDDYDFIIIDCPPSLNMLTVNALTTADTVLVPIQCEYYALEGISQLIHTIDLIHDRLNEKLKIEGVVFTMYDARTNLSSDVVNNVKENLDTKIYNSIIPRNVRLAEAPSNGMPINLYDSKSSGAESYRNLAKEIIERNDL
jgi:chromosome partitioning protein